MIGNPMMLTQVINLRLVSQKAAGNAVAIVTIALIVHRGSVEAAAVATAWFTTRGQPQLSVTVRSPQPR
ncbi:uncharacterized protein CLUP02_17200 [Colletotrichum lupini]|uniref:Uncharacterized protein n=1 Tax=Colletotrichum lupini TaxID=145971 RepID=A0A9Q8T994_9PEZI|nr:uncharacterized protein CLUP02_17200 [Colletotrichum lupini]UQC91664.1 hypothetical protein CLUP02_17200 [Colletotrichum lupini]